MIEQTGFEEVKLRTGIDPNFLADTLTTDIELTDALFDLIDNSIDSARNSIIRTEYNKDIRGLPNDYSGFEIKVRFGANSIVVEDNCIGIDNNALEQDAFYTGKRSNHKFGIGHYGLGLKRALLKAGIKYGMLTDNGESLYKASFDRQSFSSDGESDLIAKKFSTTGMKRTVLVVSNLYPNIISQISDSEWFSNAINQLSVRYSIFLRKGLNIKVVNTQKNNSATLVISPSIPELRNDGLMKKIGDSLTTSTVFCDFSVGIHERYRFPGEWEHDQKSNERLTKSYGVYYICNDRVIVSASTEDKHGFTTQWHSEYGGFVCLAYITSENPKELPWNTAKTEIKVNSPLFLQIRKKIEPLAKRYRAESKALINIWSDTKGLSNDERRNIFAVQTGSKRLSKAEISAISRKNNEKKGKEAKSRADSEEVPTSPNLKTSSNSQAKASKNSNWHAKNWKQLLPGNQFPISKKDKILDAMIIEAINIDIDNVPHASCLLYRSLFEAAFRSFVKSNKLFEAVKLHYYSKGEGVKKNHPEEYKKQQGIDLSICSHWILDNSQLFPPESKKRLQLCAKNLRKHIQLMNGVVHGNQIVGNDGKVQAIRNETIELLEFLVNADIHS